MKKLKFLQLIILVAIIGLLTECKKGEDDPFLSLRSRKARITGDWKMKSGTLLYSSSGPNSSNTSNIILTGNTYASTYSNTYNGVTTSNSDAGTFSYELEIEKDGDFKMTQIADGDIYTYSGTWNFTSGIGELKNKEQIVLHFDNETYSGSTIVYSGNKTNYTYNIKELRNKTLVIYSEETESEDGYIDSAKEEYTFEQ